ncbi:MULTISPECIES: GlxA family transcriptional regulator [Olivibacter]|uniref:GlxA family transcriptional regulator n=2 Tax=Olivibacter TaxID=376469 RepID=A0ABV6HQ81_9SPHI|nr:MULTISPECIES: helix-turn-helix domain-containing protein [Olivibacter]MCL4640133.1 helix-turn-helix domain-containing protein [Olivibacter sp. UJ_SKK_5.1]MDM8174095.1 helix-turn-helix domain-containing protein [Olivibacter sp. 47]MDX3917212.1 helix-turn-helix domain-containing protein [Pseudosphingobacterium sp.]QEL03876.1 helix-turn-helix domain-containing protein [Olivibacter sp. LS-1]
MKHISILIPEGHTSITNIEGTHQIFSEVNECFVRVGRPPLFDIKLVGINPNASQRNGVYTIKPDHLIGEVSKTDLIIIPAMLGDLENALKLNAAFIPWVVKQYMQGAELASFCVGAFFLAATGLLDGKQCATHWRFANQFRQQYPNARLVDDKIMTEDRGIYTSGGAYSYTNLLLYLVEKHAGREIAVLIAKTFMIDIDRYSQSPFIMFKGQKEHEDDLIIKAQEFIEKNFQEKITVDQLADMLALGRRSLERRFKKATSNTVTEYIQRVKMEAAKKELETSRKTVSELMYEIGYSDTKAFRSTFKKITGLSPIEYRNKYNKESIVLS